MTCPRCDTPAEEGQRFCTACGLRLTGAPAHGPGDGPSDPADPGPVPLLVECPACGGSNAVSRTSCALCHAALSDAAPQPATPPPAAPPAEDDPARAQPVSSGLLAVVLLAGLITAGVLLALVMSRALATGEEERPGGVTVLPVESVTASSELEDAYAAEMVTDGDPTTAWQEGTEGDGTGAWIELTLPGPAAITRLLVWNGYQKGSHFAENGRARRLAIDAGDRSFVVDLLDIEGPQAVDLPTPVRAQRLRLTVEAIYPGDRYPDLAVSEIVVEGVAVTGTGNTGS